MCKIIVVPNCSKIENAQEFAKYCASILSDQPDGYGFAYQGEKGSFGAKTMFPDAFAFLDTIPDYVDASHETFGIESKVTGAGIFHGRISTNNVSMINTHPIQRDGWHLIHNGVVTNHSDKYSMNTSNDSEHVLYHLINGGIQDVSKHLTGYYAAAAIDPEGLLHVFRDKIAPLYYSYSRKLDTPILATTKDLIESIGEYLGETLTSMPIKDDIYIVFKGKDCLLTETFESRGYDTHSRSLSWKSLGTGFDWDSYESQENVINIGYNDDFDNVSEMYLEEIKYLDESYIIKKGFTQISVYDFIDLPLKEQLQCDVYRADGTLVKPFYQEVS